MRKLMRKVMRKLMFKIKRKIPKTKLNPSQKLKILSLYENYLFNVI